MAGPVVSAVIPAYERPRRTQRAIDSVVDQSYDSLELFVVDDGSDPPLGPELSIPAGRFEEAAVLTHETNRGANAARNTGIDHASGEYVAFLDSDDEWQPAKTERQVAQLSGSSPYEASYTSVRQVDENGRLNAIQRASDEGDLHPVLLTGNAIGTFSSVMVSTEAVDTVGRPDPAMPCWQDWEWYLRLSRHAQFGRLKAPLTVRHNEGGQISSDYETKRDEAYATIERRIRELAPSEQRLETGLAHLDFQLGYAALSNGHYAEARANFLRAIRRHPTDWAFYAYLACAGKHYPLVRRAKRELASMSSLLR